jgi:hypothetical protein
MVYHTIFFQKAKLYELMAILVVRATGKIKILI